MRVSDLSEEEPGDAWILYHGSQNRFSRFTSPVVYLTADEGEAISFAHNVHRPGIAATQRFLMTVSCRPGPSLDIEDDEFFEELTEGDIEQHVLRLATEHRSRYAYLTFSHPSAMADQEFEVIVSINPRRDLRIIDTEPLEPD